MSVESEGWGELRPDRAWRFLEERDDESESVDEVSESEDYQWPSEIEYYADAALTLPGMGEQPASCESIYPLDFCKQCGHVSYRASTCEMRRCPHCWRAWTRRRSETATARLAAARLSEPADASRRLLHVSVSPPPGSIRTLTDVARYRRKAYEKAQDAGIRGGAVVEHGWRVKEEFKEAARQARESDDIEFDGGVWKFVREVDRHWRSMVYWSPHFHVVGLCRDLEPDTGDEWVVERLSSADPMESAHDESAYESMVSMLMYVLSHVSIELDSGQQSVRWFGTLANNKFSPSESLSDGMWSVVQRYASEAASPGGFGDDGDDEDEVFSPDGECLSGTEGCAGTSDDLEPIWNAGQWMMDQEWCERISREALTELDVAFSWMIGELDPPPGLRYPDSEEESREVLQAMMARR